MSGGSDSTGGQPERLTFHDGRVAFPTWLNDRLLMYLATDDEGYGPWVHAMDVERRIQHRVFAGVEPITSLAASADGRRLVATVSRSKAGLWRVPIGDRVMEESDTSPVSLQTGTGLSPRWEAGSLIYRGARAGRVGLSRQADSGAAVDLWNGINGRVEAGPALARDGRLAFLVHRHGHTELYVMNGDGTGIRRVADTLDVRGAPAWSPDGQWLAIAAADAAGVPRLFKIPVAGGPPVPLVKEYLDRSGLGSGRPVSHLFGCRRRHRILRPGGDS